VGEKERKVAIKVPRNRTPEKKETRNSPIIVPETNFKEGRSQYDKAQEQIENKQEKKGAGTL